MAQSRWRRFAPPRPRRRSSPPTADSPSRTCRARPPRSTRRWRKSRLENLHPGIQTVIASQRSAQSAAPLVRNDDNQKSEETTMPQSAKRVVLVSRPVGEPKASDFRVEDHAMPTPGPGQVLLRTIWLSLDPYMRGRMSDGP